MDDSANLISDLPRVLILCSGGSRMFKALGFLAPLEDDKRLEIIDTFCGVSIGAMVSLLLVAGYSIRQIIGQLCEMDLTKDLSSINFKTIVTHGGIISNEPLKRRLTQLIIDKFGVIPSLNRLYMMTGKSLITVVYNSDDEITEMKGPFTDPNLSCIDAVMFSMNIPFIFYELLHNNKVMADGVLADPYPVKYFDNDQTNILAIYLKSVNPTNESSKHTDIIHKMNNESYAITHDYAGKILNIMLDQYRSRIIAESSTKCCHVCLEIPDRRWHNINPENIGYLLGTGYNEGYVFINQAFNSFQSTERPIVYKYSYPEYLIETTKSDVSNLINFD